MKRSSLFLLPVAALSSLALSSYGADRINDTWSDGTRTDPASPTYSENGVDADADGNLESAWFSSSGAALTVPAAGDLRATVGTGSLSLTTYLTPAGSPITLVNPGDSLTVKWVFTMTGLNPGNANQGFRLALANSAGPGARLAADGASPANNPYLGYAMFMNLAGTLNNANSFQLLERNPGLTSDLLSTGGNWTGRANGATIGDPGYASGTQYTFLMTLMLDPSIAGQLDISAKMSGTGLGPGGQGFIQTSFNDTTPASLTFDMFGLRPANSSAAATQFDTSQFEVDFTAAPEPSIFALGGLGMLGCAWAYRRLRR